MPTCPACGGQNPEGFTNCQNCGSSLLSGGPTQTPYTISGTPEPPPAFSPTTLDPFGINPPPPPAPAHYSPAVGYAQGYAAQPPKDRTLALLLEILPALFGIFGIGRMYAGDTTTGLIWLVGGLVWGGIQALTAAFTLGLSCLCTIPISLVAVGTAGYLLNNYIKQRPQEFGLY